MNKSLLAVVVLLAGSVSAHAQVFGSSAAQGAVLGGIAGAVIGNNSGGRHAGEGAVIGAVAGAVLGAVADQQARPTTVVQAPPPCTPPPQVVYVQTAQPAPAVVYVQQPQQVVVYPAQTVVYVDAWGRPLPYGYHRYGYGCGVGRRW
jgi:hypothetical protein